MRNEYGFTLIELLAVFVILGILLGIAVPSVSHFVVHGKYTYYQGLEETTLSSAKDYLLDYRSLYPRKIGDKSIVTVQELVDNHYMDQPTDEDGNSCSGSVVIVRLKRKRYEYHTCLVCENKYQSDEQECEYAMS